MGKSSVLKAEASPLPVCSFGSDTKKRGARGLLLSCGEPREGCSVQRAKPLGPLPASPHQPCDPDRSVTLLHLVSKPSNSAAAILPQSQSLESGTE